MVGINDYLMTPKFYYFFIGETYIYIYIYSIYDYEMRNKFDMFDHLVTDMIFTVIES